MQKKCEYIPNSEMVSKMDKEKIKPARFVMCQACTLY